jgi:RimJ/RimL family protein N-acetyltransferase
MDRKDRLITERLILRRWRDEDREPFARMNADAAVMRFMPSLLTREESDAVADRIEEHFRRHGFGPYALELRSNRTFIGYTGLHVPTFTAEFTPCIEIAWRLDCAHWNRGLATEAARAVVDHAFGQLAIQELVAFTVPANLASRRVMEKLGMTHDRSDEFEHPKLPEGHPLRRHVLYRLQKS